MFTVNNDYTSEQLELEQQQQQLMKTQQDLLKKQKAKLIQIVEEYNKLALEQKFYDTDKIQPESASVQDMIKKINRISKDLKKNSYYQTDEQNQRVYKESQECFTALVEQLEELNKPLVALEAQLKEIEIQLLAPRTIPDLPVDGLQTTPTALAESTENVFETPTASGFFSRYPKVAFASTLVAASLPTIAYFCIEAFKDFLSDLPLPAPLCLAIAGVVLGGLALQLFKSQQSTQLKL